MQGKETKGEITFQSKHLEGVHSCQLCAVTLADDNSSSARDRWEIANFVLPDEDIQCKSSYNSYELWILLLFSVKKKIFHTFSRGKKKYCKSGQHRVCSVLQNMK